MMTRMTVTLAAAALALTATLAPAQEADPMAGMDHSKMGHSAMEGAMGEMMTAMDTMMAAMPAKSTGMVDADFLLLMIPHHQSAIDMARVELAQGTDAGTKAMAQKVIDAQEAEIAEMKAMLERMGVAVPAAPVE